MTKMDDMGATPVYGAASVLISLVAMVLATVYLKRASDVYRRFHDDRAAVSLGKAVGLFVISLGLVVSALGLVVEQATLSTIGLSLARGALLVTLMALVLAGVRPGDND
jgi:multisubunit Na+/H+ antiporter MnhG subunit